MEKLGITSERAISLKKEFGENLLPHKERSSWYTIFSSQFNNPFVILLIVIGVLSFYFKEFLDVALIGLVILFNIITGFIQEFSAQRTLAALREIIKSKSTVVRDGKRTEIETKDLVPGDVVIIGSGDKIPADGKIIKGTNILVSEAILTGEEEAIEKSLDTDKCAVYMGTTVIAGQGLMEVEKIGQETKIGRIGQSLSEIEDEATPLQKRLQKFTKYIIYIVSVICTIIFVWGILRGGDVWETLQVSIVLSIAAIPEGLPIAITVILAIGMRRVLKRKGLVKRLLSIETLGSTSVVCLDKTGTLTEGVMQVKKTEFSDNDQAILAATLLNDRKTAMEIAIWNYLKKESKNDPEIVSNSYERIHDEPFDSAKKYKMIVYKIDGKGVAHIEGAPEIVLKFCKTLPGEKKKLTALFNEWAKAGLRIVAIAQKSEGAVTEKKDFVWLGLIGIEDPVRSEAKSALHDAEKAGIDIKIVTGDYQLTAEQVAKKIGMDLTPENIMNCEDLDSISDEILIEKIGAIKLFSRVTPMQKLRIVDILQKKGEIVAMTGDGVNDAPAIKKADIGIVVENGTDVAKEAGDLVLLDSNFKTIVAACEEGRVIFSNIKKVVAYVLSNSFDEIILITGSMFLGLPVPLTVAQLLWINLVCDGPPDIVLGFEPKEEGIMKLDPRDLKRENILSLGVVMIILAVSMSVGISGLLVFWYFEKVVGNPDLARTIVFTLLAIISITYIFSFKNLHRSIIHTKHLLNNPYLILSVIYGLVLVVLAVYVPSLNKVLNTVPLSLNHWILITLISLFIIAVVEIVKAKFIGTRYVKS